MDSNFVPGTLAKAAWGFPTLFALHYRGVQGSEGPIAGAKSLAAAGFPVRVAAEDYRRVSAILNVYLHAPADNTQTPHVDPRMHIASRTYDSGPLAGFYASRTFNFGHGLVTYKPDSAWLMSTADATATVPLPKGYSVKSVTEVGWEGHNQPIAFHQDRDNLELKVRDSSAVSRYVIDYTKDSK
jgi:hypothetical protein